MIATFPTVLDDELVYSVLCRFFDRSGILSYRHAAEALFLNKMAKPVIEFVNEYTDDVLALLLKHNSMEELILQHTMAPYYMRFLDLPRRTAAMKALTSMDNSYWQHLLLPSNRTKGKDTKRYLRFCPICAREDRARHGETYWHRSHQLRHIDVCPIHGCSLKESEIAITTEGPPALVSAESVVPLQYDALPCENELQLRLAQYVNDVFHAPMNMRSTVTTGAFFRSRLEGTPYISLRGERRNLRLLYQDFSRFYASIPNHPLSEMWQVEKLFCNHNHSMVPVCMMGLFLDIFVQDLCAPSLPEKTQAQRFDEEVLRLHEQGLKYPAIAKRMNAALELVKKVGEGRAIKWYDGERRRFVSPNSGPKKLDYNALDAEYLPKVKAAVTELYGKNGERPHRVTVTSIESMLSIPTYRMGNCPRCMEVIRLYLEKQEQYWARESVWAAKQLIRDGIPLSKTRLLQLINLRVKNYERCIPYLPLFADGDLLQQLQNLLGKEVGRK